MDLGSIRFLVLDEADHLIANHKLEVLKVWNAVPKAELQVLMFSATLHSPEVKELGEKLCKFPTWVDLKGKDSVPDVSLLLSLLTCRLWTMHLCGLIPLPMQL